MEKPAPPPKVSVLLPTYKYARYLPQAIESILEQTYTDFELIVSDDASDDGSAEIIRSYAEQDPRIRWHVQCANLGMGHNWNWCLDQASGELIKFVFGDDFLVSRNALARLVGMIESAPDIAIAASARMVVNENSQRIETWNHIGRPGVFDGTETINWCLRTNCNLIGEPSVVLFRKTFVAKPFDTTFKQVLDWDFWIDLMQRGHLAYTDEPLCAFRTHPHQQSELNRQADGAGNEHPKLFKRYARYLVPTRQHADEAYQLLRYLRQKRIKSADDLMFIETISQALGDTQFQYWVRWRLTRLGMKARRTWYKHVLRRNADSSRPVRAPLPIREVAPPATSPPLA